MLLFLLDPISILCPGCPIIVKLKNEREVGRKVKQIAKNKSEDFTLAGQRFYIEQLSVIWTQSILFLQRTVSLMIFLWSVKPLQHIAGSSYEYTIVPYADRATLPKIFVRSEGSRRRKKKTTTKNIDRIQRY